MCGYIYIYIYIYIYTHDLIVTLKYHTIICLKYIIRLVYYTVHVHAHIHTYTHIHMHKRTHIHTSHADA